MWRIKKFKNLSQINFFSVLNILTGSKYNLISGVRRSVYDWADINGIDTDWLIKVCDESYRTFPLFPLLIGFVLTYSSYIPNVVLQSSKNAVNQTSISDSLLDWIIPPSTLHYYVTMKLNVWIHYHQPTFYSFSRSHKPHSTLETLDIQNVLRPITAIVSNLWGNHYIKIGSRYSTVMAPHIYTCLTPVAI